MNFRHFYLGFLKLELKKNVQDLKNIDLYISKLFFLKNLYFLFSKRTKKLFSIVSYPVKKWKKLLKEIFTS